MTTLADQLTEEQRNALVPTAEKDVAEAVELSIQRRVSEAAASMPAVWWFTEPQAQWDVAPWWSPQRDTDLRAFVKREGNDILAGAVSSMVKKFKAMNWTLEGPKSTVNRMQEMLSEAAE